VSIDLYMEDEEGAPLGEVLDPDDLTGRIVALAAHGGTACLRFVHPEGNTVFNQLQIPTLVRELRAAWAYVTDERLAALGESELASARAAQHGPSLIHAIKVRNDRVQTADVLAHLEKVIALAEEARGRPHTYLKFYGD
jgi:hypothetical protein